MRIVFMGSGQFGMPSLSYLAKNHKLVEIFTQPARPAGRGRKVTPTPVELTARELGIPFREAENINALSEVEHIRTLNPDIILVIAFGQWIGKEILALPNCRILNLHSSLLPKYRGAAPINWAIINGESETGITIFELNEQWDAGNILGQHRTPIHPLETAGELHDRLAAMGPLLISEILRKIADGAIHPYHQDDSLACKAPKLQKSSGAIDWSRPANEIACQIRGMWPWPGGYCHLLTHGNTEPIRLTLVRAESFLDNPANSPPGCLLPDMSIACGSGSLKIHELKPQNSKVMSYKAFLNGHQLSPGDCFLNG